MKFTNGLLAIAGLLFLTACDNELDLTGDYIETPVVLGLLNYTTDTQFVRINKTFLERGVNAEELAKDPYQLVYDTLIAFLVNKSNNQKDTLNTILKSKDAGVFSDEKNILYYSTTPLSVGNTYELVIETPTGLVARAETKAIDTVSIDKPKIQEGHRKQDLSLISLNNKFLDYKFKVSYPAEIARFEIKMFLLYEEVTAQGRKKMSVEAPIARIENEELIAGKEFEVVYGGEQFYKAIAKAIPKDGIRREVGLNNSIRIEIYAADNAFRFYSNLNGPIDGLSQVRPEYSNIENGIGLFASRAYSIGYTQLQQRSRQELLSGSITSGRGFVDP